jgi:hypothetical protein
MNETDRKRMHVDGDVDYWQNLKITGIHSSWKNHRYDMNLRELNMKISISILLFTVAIKQLQHCRIAADC